MSGKKMERNEQQRRRAAREARKRGNDPSAEGTTMGASKQRRHLPQDEDHREKIETIRRGKQPDISENVPDTRPRVPAAVDICYPRAGSGDGAPAPGGANLPTRPRRRS